ncbi:Kazal-type serine protease inhibitor family protein [Eleftheria terrae]|uniref:Kazal-type serine protease inhibitor family protein n=1 Tax=Eleftheria terrae TaxID=1597781 RepID=UPI00263BB382|nr:Kazal-type serine protease inhibitor family protein [Eleftheria terrae]WKB55575.1 Kazal-type serine protease inhibitor family protein [Eleftheria terrae]
MAQEPAAAAASADEAMYYIVTRPDLRRCAFPMCGGYFVRAVNKPRTQCADGSWQAECHAAVLDTAPTRWSEGERAAFLLKFGQGHALVRGTLAAVRQEGLPWIVPTLTATEGWEGQVQRAGGGAVYRVQDNGIRCITHPCPSIEQQALNFVAKRAIAGVELDKAGASAQQTAEGVQALSAPGLLVAGRHRTVSGPGGVRDVLVATEFYLQRLAQLPATPRACGGKAGAAACGAGEFCDASLPNACAAGSVAGACRTVPDVCIALADPVCGCDGVTYGNDCERAAARVQLAHRGACEGAAPTAAPSKRR